jgi:hypothetical protein
MTKIEQIKAAIEKHAFTYPGNYGRGTFEHRISCVQDGNTVTLHSKISACVDKQTAWDKLSAVITDSDLGGGKRRRTGWYHMGSFRHDGYSYTVVLKA